MMPELSAAVDGLRGIAVLAVVTYHACAWNHIFSGAKLSAEANAGARGVDLFFVISGFCLAYRYLRGPARSDCPPLDMRHFYIRRFARIAPPFYVSLAVFACLSLTPFGFPADIPGQAHALNPPLELVMDFLFAPSPNSIYNSVYWTLGVEMRWYLICPLLIVLYNRSRTFFVATGLCGYLLFAAGMPFEDLALVPCFMLGIIAADVVRSVRDQRIFVIVPFAAIGLLCFAIYGGTHRNSAYNHADPIWHLAAFLMVVSIGSGVSSRILGTRPLAAVGRASYSIYLIHLPVLSFLVRHDVPYLAAAGVAIAAGFLFWLSVERWLLHPERRTRIEGVLGIMIPKRPVKVPA